MRIWLCSGRAVTMVLAVPTTIPQPPLMEDTWWVRVALSLCRERWGGEIQMQQKSEGLAICPQTAKLSPPISKEKWQEDGRARGRAPGPLTPPTLPWLSS